MDMSLFKHFFKVLSLYLEARIRIRIKVANRIRIRIKVTKRIRKWCGSATLFSCNIGRVNNMNWYSKRNISYNSSLVTFFCLDWNPVGRCFRGYPRPRTRRLQHGCRSLLTPSSRRDRHQDRHHSRARQVISCSDTFSKMVPYWAFWVVCYRTL